MKATGVILLFIIFIIHSSCAHKTPHENQLNGLPRKWFVGPIQGQVVTDKKFTPTKISTEMECYGVKPDGMPWTEAKEIPTKISVIKSTSETVTHKLTADAQTFIIPVGELKACAYFLKLEGPHPNGGIGTGRLPLVGELTASGMPKAELHELLSNQNLNLEINKKLTSKIPITH
ncbi:MAG: hypothetical protein V4654_12190 [Bdellovibrionota bacterium]